MFYIEGPALSKDSCCCYLIGAANMSCLIQCCLTLDQWDAAYAFLNI